MDQSNEFDDFDTLSLPPSPSPLSPPPPLPSLAPTNASDALSLLPEATYLSKEALIEAIQSWAKLRGYAFIISRSTRLPSGRQKLTFSYDRTCALPPLNINRIRNSRSRGISCPFSILGVKTPSQG